MNSTQLVLFNLNIFQSWNLKYISKTSKALVFYDKLYAGVCSY